MAISQRKTETHFYFWGGVMSNFHRFPGRYSFYAPLWRGGPKLGFHHSEGYFMAIKALMFGATVGHVDEDGMWVPSILERILAEPIPKYAKALGRQIEGFDEERWKKVSRDVMFRAVWWKFIQNVELARALVDTKDLILVEGSPLDRIWGVGLAWDDPRIEDEANWQGSNWLGDILMMVRNVLMAMDAREAEYFDPFVTSYEVLSQGAVPAYHSSSSN